MNNIFKYSDNNKRYHTLDYFYKHKFNSKVFKVSLNAGLSCPNIDGTVGKGGCIYCSNSGSGEFAGNKNDDIITQFNEIKKMMFLLKGEIAYGSCTINEALANISTRCGMNIDNILENIASDTEGNFYENWEQKWNDGFLNMHLSKNIKADILNFKDVLGLADKSGELSQIDLFLSRLQNEIDNTENILPQKCRMYRCLAVGAGIILSIIII